MIGVTEHPVTVIIRLKEDSSPVGSRAVMETVYVVSITGPVMAFTQISPFRESTLTFM